MATEKTGFSQALELCADFIAVMGLAIEYTDRLDPYFKGDLDGKHIFIAGNLAPEEKLFNLLHLAGHSIQWNIDENLRSLGSTLHHLPAEAVLNKLQVYEWEANCYGLSILHAAKILSLDEWLAQEYVSDMLHLTHYYKTGEKLRQVTAVARLYPFTRTLKVLPLPNFIATAGRNTRNGIVLSF